MENGENLVVESQTGGEEEEEGDTRGLTRSALGPAVGETSSEGPDRDSLNSASSGNGQQREEENDYQDDVDDEITAVFAENGAGDDGMSKSWHGSRSASQKSLSFFVDINGAESPGPPPLTRSMSHSQSCRQVSSARCRTRTSSCSTSFFVDISGVRSVSRMEQCAQLDEMSVA